MWVEREVMWIENGTVLKVCEVREKAKVMSEGENFRHIFAAHIRSISLELIGKLIDL